MFGRRLRNLRRAKRAAAKKKKKVSEWLVWNINVTVIPNVQGNGPINICTPVCEKKFYLARMNTSIRARARNGLGNILN